MTAPADDPVGLCLAGRLPPGVALARLILAGRAPEAIAPLLPAGSELAALFAAQRGRLDGLVAMARGLDHGAATGSVAAIAAMFDRAVAVAPEASVAAYSLGDAGLLAAATAELVRWLRDNGYASADADVLDLGCGIGRVAAALAPHVRSVLGLDVSPGMVAEARRRQSADRPFPSLRFAVTDGAPLTGHAPASLDLVLAVDSMPYLVQAGIARTHVAALRRLLRPRGHLVVLNLSYGGGDEADRAEAEAWAQGFGFELRTAGERPFSLWDGAAFVLGVTA